MDAWPASPCPECFPLVSLKEVADTAMRFVGMALARVAANAHHRGLKPMVPRKEIEEIKGGAAWTADTAKALYERMQEHPRRDQLSDKKPHTATNVPAELIDDVQPKRGLVSRWDGETWKW